MKHLKTFEISQVDDALYKKGDYVKIVSSLVKDSIVNCFNIQGIRPKKTYDNEIVYIVEYYDSDSNVFHESYIYESQIDDYADEDDIIEYETRNNTNKYNL